MFKPSSNFLHIVRLAIFVLLTAGLSGINSYANAAENCDARLGQKPIGSIEYGKINLPIVSFTYPRGGIMDPPATTGLAGISALHAPLNSTTGSSIILWHHDYNGCIGKLNSMIDRPAGYKFALVDSKGKKVRYTVKKTFTVKVGAYKKEWFTLNGLRQIVLVSCTGPFVNGHHTENFVAIATPD